MVYETNSAEETYNIAFELGKKVQLGEIICLEGELGVGKTVFAQGFAKGLGVEDYINSPTFTIVQVYEEGRIPLYHFDVYRISDIDEMEEIGYEEYFFGDGVCLIEWASLIKEIIPDTATEVRIEKSLSKDFDYRRIEISKSLS